MIVPGAVIELVIAAAAARSISSLLFGVQPLDPVTFLLVTTALAITATIATVAPAWSPRELIRR